MFDFMRNSTHFGNSLLDYTLALILFLVVVILITVVQKFVVRRFKKLETTTKGKLLAGIGESMGKRLLPITYSIAVYAGLSYLNIPETLEKRVDRIIIIFVAVFVIMFINDLIRNFVQNYQARGRSALPSGVVSVIQFLVWVIGILFVFANMGYNVSTFITGLGIGGVAIALASQAILGDLFNYFVILFDKPFKKGDLIQVGDMSGTVEYIGIKSTRIRSNNGEMLLISNTDLTKSRIQNFRAAKKRRYLATIGVTYETNPKKLRELPDIIKNVVTGTAGTEFSRVHFSAFGDSSLNFELAYFVLSNDYSDYVKTVQEVNFALVDAFAKEGVDFAYPTRTLYLNNGAGDFGVSFSEDGKAGKEAAVAGNESGEDDEKTAEEASHKKSF